MTQVAFVKTQDRQAGVESPGQIELVADDADSEAHAAEIHRILVGR